VRRRKLTSFFLPSRVINYTRKKTKNKKCTDIYNRCWATREKESRRKKEKRRRRKRKRTTETTLSRTEKRWWRLTSLSFSLCLSDLFLDIEFFLRTLEDSIFLIAETSVVYVYKDRIDTYVDYIYIYALRHGLYLINCQHCR